MALSTGSDPPPSHGWNAAAAPSDMVVGSTVSGRAAEAIASHCGGSSVPGSTSRSATVASRWVQALGTTLTTEYPPPPNANQRPPAADSARSRSAR